MKAVADTIGMQNYSNDEPVSMTDLMPLARPKPVWLRLSPLPVGKARSPWSCAPRPASPGCGATRISAPSGRLIDHQRSGAPHDTGARRMSGMRPGMSNDRLEALLIVARALADTRPL